MRSGRIGASATCALEGAKRANAVYRSLATAHLCPHYGASVRIRCTICRLPNRKRPIPQQLDVQRIAGTLRRWMEEADILDFELEDRVKVDRRTIRKLLAGETKNPQPPALAKLSRFFGYPGDALERVGRGEPLPAKRKPEIAHLGQAIEIARRVAGATIEQLEAAAGLAPGRLAALEQGEAPLADEVEAIETALGLMPGMLEQARQKPEEPPPWATVKFRPALKREP